MRDAIITLISYGFDHKTFFWGVVLVRAQGFVTGVKYDQVILEQCGKRVKLKVKVLKANSYFWRSYREKPVQGIGLRDTSLTDPYPRNDDTKRCIIILIITIAIIIIAIANNNTNSVVSNNFISLINTKG